jgi:hypothetical protein
MIQLVGIKLKLRLAFEDDMVLIYLRIHRADLALTKGVVQSVIDGGGSDTKARRSHPVYDQRYSQTAHLLIGGDILQFRQLLKPSDESVGPVVEFVSVGVL